MINPWATMPNIAAISTVSQAFGVVVELQTNRCPFLPDSRNALASGCMALSRNSFEKLPSGKLGEGGMKNDASVAIASRTSSVARQRARLEERSVGNGCLHRRYQARRLVFRVDERALARREVRDGHAAAMER